MTILIANTCSAFSPSAIGTRVLDGDAFLNALKTAIANYVPLYDRAAGQHSIRMPETAYRTVSAGVGKRSLNPQDYILREHRGQVAPYLKREKAATVGELIAIVYTQEAYLKDPDVKNDPGELARVNNSDATHILVTVLTSAGPHPTYSSHRFVMNLAGGNNEALTWSAPEIRMRAAEVVAYAAEWSVVADPG